MSLSISLPKSRNHRDREAERQLALHVCQVIQRMAKLLDDRDIQDATSLKEDLEDALPIFQTIHQVLILRAKQAFRMRFGIGSGSNELSNLSTQLDRIMINMTFSSTARTEIATRKLLRANSQAPENIPPPYEDEEDRLAGTPEPQEKRITKRQRSPSAEDEETTHTKRRISDTCKDSHQLRPNVTLTSAVEAFEAVSVHLKSIQKAEGCNEKPAAIKNQSDQSGNLGATAYTAGDMLVAVNAVKESSVNNVHKGKRRSISPKRSHVTSSEFDITKRKKVGLSAIGQRLGLLKQRKHSN